MGLKAALKVIGGARALSEQEFDPTEVSYWAPSYEEIEHILTAYDSDPVSPQSVDIDAAKPTASAVDRTPWWQLCGQWGLCGECGHEWPGDHYRQCPKCYPPCDLKAVDDTAKSPSEPFEGTLQALAAGLDVELWKAMDIAVYARLHPAVNEGTPPIKEVTDCVATNCCMTMYGGSNCRWKPHQDRCSDYVAPPEGTPSDSDRSAQSGESVDQGLRVGDACEYRHGGDSGMVTVLYLHSDYPATETPDVVIGCLGWTFGDGGRAKWTSSRWLTRVDTPHNPGGIDAQSCGFTAEERLLVLEGVRDTVNIVSAGAAKNLVARFTTAIANLREGK